jgi:hypothetical protein
MIYTSPPRICLQRKHAEQIRLNHQLMDDISELQQEAKLIREIPKRLSESVGNCKDTYEDVLSIVQVKSIPMFQFFFFFLWGEGAGVEEEERGSYMLINC